MAGRSFCNPGLKLNGPHRGGATDVEDVDNPGAHTRLADNSG